MEVPSWLPLEEAAAGFELVADELLSFLAPDSAARAQLSRCRLPLYTCGRGRGLALRVISLRFCFFLRSYAKGRYGGI